jgi:hypothetical protein
MRTGEYDNEKRATQKTPCLHHLDLVVLLACGSAESLPSLRILANWMVGIGQNAADKCAGRLALVRTLCCFGQYDL